MPTCKIQQAASNFAVLLQVMLLMGQPWDVAIRSYRLSVLSSSVSIGTIYYSLKPGL